jgi:DNA repair protein RadC
MEIAEQAKNDTGAPGDTRPVTMTYVREIAINYRGPRRPRAQITRAGDAAAYIRKVLPDNSREHFVSLYLDNGHRIAGFSITATGTANSCPVHPREVYQAAIALGAISVIVGHNHPSGCDSPSEEDQRVTNALKEAGAVLGINLLDHVIIGGTSFYSFAEHGVLG